MPLFHDYVGWRLSRLAQRAVESGLAPRWVRYRHVRKESLEEHVARKRNPREARLETIHPETRFSNPLPHNIERRAALPAERGWWGYSMYDVPDRRSPPTLRGTLEGARVLPWVDPDVGYFRPAILTQDRSSLEMREISFRPVHARLLGSAPAPIRIERATWILERVYDNHSHWLTAHLPKLRLLRDAGKLDHVLMPENPTETMVSSMRMMGIDPEGFPTFDPTRPLDVGRLTVVATDRFRPELLRPVREALTSTVAAPRRRVYISRARAGRRRLLNEDEVWGLLQGAGFERVFMEDLDFRRQVRLMSEATVVIAPHGAGLTNMMFSQEGATVVEIADPAFPNPNFYALAAAMGLRYWLLPASAVGDGHPLEKDLQIDLSLIDELLPQLTT